MYKVGVIGLGSIGKRHVSNLLKIGISDITLLRSIGRENKFGLKEYYTSDEFFQNDYDFIIICNPSSKHYEFLTKLIPNNQNIFCEKPVVTDYNQLTKLSELLKNYKGKSITGYNMRFHPCVIRTKQIVDEGILGKILFARFFVGQYLPDWKPDIDYSKSYSATRILGGGVTLDLTHEIDLALMFFGDPSSNVFSIANRFSSLKIETEDLTEILFRSSHSALVSIHLDYLYHGYRRYIELIGEKANLHCDLFENYIRITGDDNRIIYSEAFPDFQRNDMYLSLLNYYIRNLRNELAISPDLREGLKAVNLAMKVLIDNELIRND